MMSSSQVFFDEFFPTVSTWLKSSVLSWLYRFTFPDDDNNVSCCPEPIMANMIRYPILGGYAAIGVAIGVYGAHRMLHRYRSPPAINGRRNARHSLWAAAFAAFAAMNVASIPLHCLLAPLSSSFATTLRSWLWALDTFCTGASSTAIVLATTTTTTCTIQDWTLINAMFGVVGIYAYMRYNMTLPLELWYLIPTLYGAVPSTLYWLLRKRSSNDHQKAARRTAVRLVVIGMAVTVHAVLLDRWISCGAVILLPSSYLRCCGWDLWTSPAMAFLGSDLAFATLLSYLLRTSRVVVVGLEREEEMMMMMPMTTTTTKEDSSRKQKTT
jgi:hypothetical protein